MLATSRIAACAVAVLVAALAADAAKVNTIADTMERWGALGTWASDCRRAPERGNSYFRFVRSGDRVVHERVYRRDHLTQSDAVQGLGVPAAQPSGRAIDPANAAVPRFGNLSMPLRPGIPA